METLEIRNEIKNKVLNRMDLTREVDDEEVIGIIRQEVINAAKRYVISLPQRLDIQREIYNSLRRLDVLQDLLDEEDITEIMINGANEIFVERDGKIERSDKRFSSEEKLSDVIQQIVAQNNKVVNEASPIVDTRLEDGSRINIILPPISIGGHILSIRRFPKEPITIDKLLEYGSLSEEVADFLRTLVLCRYNIFLCGSTGCGKTTFLNALSQFIPADERIITIEDAAELQIQGIDNLVRLEARSANLEGKLAVSIRELVKASLRMRPDRIIVGECRGEEALEVLQAMNTGHDGSLSTGHANSAADMLSRLETMVLMGMDLPIQAIRSQIASGIDIIVHLGRMRDGSRKLLEIVEVLGIENGEIILSTLYKYQENVGWVKGKEIRHRQKLEMDKTKSGI